MTVAGETETVRVTSVEENSGVFSWKKGRKTVAVLEKRPEDKKASDQTDDDCGNH